MIESVVATADHVGARLSSKKRLNLSVDEWNVWHQSRFAGQDTLEYISEDPALIEDVYDVHDAVVVGSLLITLLRHADRVGIACQAQLVNVIAPILTRAQGPRGGRRSSTRSRTPADGPAERCCGSSLGSSASRPLTMTTYRWSTPWSPGTRRSDGLTVLAVNRSRSEQARLEIDARAFRGLRLTAASVLAHEDPTTTNTEGDPHNVRPRRLEDVTVEDGRVTAVLPPVSWAVLRFATRIPNSSAVSDRLEALT
jgi:alpha-N-arabinofuranosidase